MFDYSSWLKENCKFAAPLERQVPNLETQRPAPEPSSENNLVQDFDQKEIMRNAIFERLAEDVRNIQAGIAEVGNPNYPTFTEAYQTIFGSPNIAPTVEVLKNLEAYFLYLHQHPNFAEAPVLIDEPDQEIA